MEKYQKVSVTAFVHKDGKVLVLKRSERETFLPGFFELPGGKVEFGEDPSDALKREMKEEVSLDIEIQKPYALFSYVSEDGNRQTVDIQFIVKVVGDNEIKISTAHEAYEWIGRENIENYKMSEEMKKAVLKGFVSI